MTAEQEEESKRTVIFRQASLSEAIQYTGLLFLISSLFHIGRDFVMNLDPNFESAFLRSLVIAAGWGFVSLILRVYPERTK